MHYADLTERSTFASPISPRPEIVHHQTGLPSHVSITGLILPPIRDVVMSQKEGDEGGKSQ